MYQQNETIMLITEQIENLKAKKSLVRTEKEFNAIEKQILKLAKQYNNNDNIDMYLIIDNQVYGLGLRKKLDPNYIF